MWVHYNYFALNLFNISQYVQCLITHLVHLEIIRLEITDVIKQNCSWPVNYLLFFICILNYFSLYYLTYNSEMRQTNFQIV